MNIKKTEVVKEQYKDEKNLGTRISIHEKYSVNKQGFGGWIFEQYQISKDFKILELGCGNGSMWKDKYNELPEGVELTLTDFSNGMLEDTKKNLGHKKNIRFMQVDIQSIPFENDSFDMVIANMMLYHVPDLQKGLFEVKRVLKPRGKFYCATFGENGIIEFVQKLLSVNSVNKENRSFTLQNGEASLTKQFSKAEMKSYEDSLEVTNTWDLVDYALSMSDFVDLGNAGREEIFAALETKREDGKICVPKEYGMFIAVK